MNKILSFILITGLIFGLTGCINGDKNKPPSVPSIVLPSEIEVNEVVVVTVRSVDPDGNRVAYKVNFGDGTETDWSEYVLSGQDFMFVYTFEEAGSYNVVAVASDRKEVSGWSDAVTIKVHLQSPSIGPERIMFCIGPNDDFAKIAESGITVIQYYSIYWEGDNGLGYLDKAHSHGLKVLYCIKPLVHDLIIAGGSWDSDECRRIIQAFENHPALWGWQAWDEPDAGVDNPVYLIPMETQRTIHWAFKQWGMRKPFIQVLRGATRGWHLVDLTIGDLIVPNYYVYDGTGHCWGEEPLVALEVALKQVREYLDSNNIQKPTSFVLQCSMVPAHGIDPHKPLPAGIIEDQFNLVKKYNLCSGGLTFWAWNGGYYSPATSDNMYQEMKNLLDKIK